MDTLVPKRWQPLVIGTLLVGLIILAFGWMQNDAADDSDDGDAIGFVIVALITLAVTYALWRYFVAPRLGGTSQTTGTLVLVLGIVTVLIGFVYWTGLIYAVGPAVIALATVAASTRDPKARAGQVLAVAGLALGVIGGFIDSVL